jgi:hypothetical protein
MKLQFSLATLLVCMTVLAVTLADCQRALAVIDQQYLPSEWTAAANVGAGNTVDWS